MKLLANLLAPALWILACGLQLMIVHVVALLVSPQYRGLIAHHKATEAKKRGQHYEAAALCKCPTCELATTCRNQRA